MEDKNELSDIVLEKDDNKAIKTKRILIIAALMILVFLVVIVLMRVINKPEQDTQSKLILPPEPAAVQQAQSQQDDQLFKQVPIIEEDADKKESFEDMVRSLKEKEVKKQETPESTTPAQQEPTQQVATKQPVQPAPVAPTPVKEVQTQAKPAPTPAQSTTATTGVYVQVGATSRLTPDKKFLDTITSKKYEYKLLDVTINNKKVTKILIGPYANTTAAKNVLADIKANINKDAFIYRVK